MTEKTFSTSCGIIHYWTNGFQPGRKSLVFLPGLTADHHLFDQQIEYFRPECNCLVWDAPGHAASYPFALDFNLFDKALWLHELLAKEGYEKPVLIGQSMGGYVGQAFLEQFPEDPGGFVVIDSAPLERKYVTGAEIWLLKHTYGIYRLYPWKSLVKAGSKGVATTLYGQEQMREMMMVYDGDPKRYCRLVSHGYRMLADAMERNLPYRITCPCTIMAGEKDAAGSTKRYNKAWIRDTGLPFHWIPDAGHNSNADNPEEVNRIIGEFLKTL